MTLNTVNSATNNVNLLPVDVSENNTTDAQNPDNLRIVPFTRTAQSDANLIANYNRARVEQSFQQENQANANDGINGITTETAFPLSVSEGETQESVMRRAFEAMADRAGLSPESRQAFVESRMKANTNAEGKALILHIDKKPPTAYTDEEWAQMRSINFFPNDADIKELKQFKSTDNFNAGTQSADEIIRALELGNRSYFDKLMSDTDASTELAKALNKVRQNGANYDFQQGLLNRLGAERAVQLEDMLKDNFRYNSIIREAISTTGMQLPDRQDRTGSIRREIAERSSLEALVRMTSDNTYPMDKNFLVGAGKRVMTKDIGWTTRVGGGGMEMPVKINIYHEGTKGILYKIARNPEASLELLQDAEFVRNATILENSGENEDTISQIIRSGTSREMREKNQEQVNNATRVVTELIKEPGKLKGTAWSGISESKTIVTERMANAMVDMFINNPSAFVAATSMDNENGVLDRDDFRKFVGAVRQHKDAMNRLTAAVAIEYMKLVGRAESGGLSNATRAGDLKGAFVDAIMQENVRDAREADEQRERIAKAISIVGEVGSFYGLGSLGVHEIPADLLGKTVAAVIEDGGKGSNVEQAKTTNTEILDRQDSLSAMTTVTIFEKAARERLARQEGTSADREFLQALRVYNGSLPAGEKILDESGQLINFRTASAKQRHRIVLIFRAETSGNQTELDKAVRLLDDRMGATYRELRDAADNQLRPQ
jgi:hypothetical protein